MPACAFDESGLELVDPATPSRDNARGNVRFSQVPVEPHLSVCSCSRDPGRTDVSDPFVRRPCCPRSFNYEDSDDGTIEAQWHGFRTCYLRFVVQVTRTPRKTRSRLLVKLCRTGLSPVKAPLKGFNLNFS